MARKEREGIWYCKMAGKVINICPHLFSPPGLLSRRKTTMNDLKKGKLVSALLIAWSALYMVVVVASFLQDSKWIQMGVSVSDG